MKKVLVVITTEFVEYGGLTNVMMNYYKALDKENLQIDFASTNIPKDVDLSYRYIIKNGSKYYCLGNRKKHLISYLKKLKRLLKDNNYDVVHVNGNSSTMFLELYVAKKLGIPIRIAHGHTTKSNYPIVHLLLKKELKGCYTHAISVSDKTGKWLFNDNYIILNNAINLEKYQYNIDIRNKIRRQMNLDGYTVIGNIGKLYASKNQKFLIEVFSYYKKNNEKSKLILVGGGELEEKLREYAKKMRIEKDIIFLGMRNDVQDIIQAFDIFVFPSIYEGLGLALIEAQAAGLKCIASDTVPIETKVTENVIYYSLKKSPEDWANKIFNINYDCREQQAINVIKSIREHGYDIKYEADKLKKIYMS